MKKSGPKTRIESVDSRELREILERGHARQVKRLRCVPRLDSSPIRGNRRGTASGETALSPQVRTHS